MELERKFLIEEPTDKLFKIREENKEKVTPIYQYYILLEGNKEMRVRKRNTNGDSEYTLTVKDGSGGMRDEISFHISEDMFNYQKEKAVGCINKDRLYCKLEHGLTTEIDFFENFIIAEVEFKSGYQYMEFEEYTFIELGLATKIREVTTDPKYKNKNIAYTCKN